jgi:hypothetical protein
MVLLRKLTISRAQWRGLTCLVRERLRSSGSRVRGCHDRLSQKPSPLFVLLGWSSVCFASPEIRSICLLSSSPEKRWSVAACGDPGWCCVRPPDTSLAWYRRLCRRGGPSTLKIETSRFSETLASTKHFTRRLNPKEDNRNS